MAKLKYDRPINVDTSSGRTIYVPDNEVWKVTADERNLGPTTNIYGGGYRFERSQTVTGIAFKHIDD